MRKGLRIRQKAYTIVIPRTLTHTRSLLKTSGASKMSEGYYEFEDEDLTGTVCNTYEDGQLASVTLPLSIGVTSVLLTRGDVEALMEMFTKPHCSDQLELGVTITKEDF